VVVTVNGDLEKLVRLAAKLKDAEGTLRTAARYEEWDCEIVESRSNVSFISLEAIGVCKKYCTGYIYASRP